MPVHIIENPYIRERTYENRGILESSRCLYSLVNYIAPEKKFIVGTIKYPPSWTKSSDIFQFFTKEALSELRSKRAYFLFDSSQEGFDSLSEYFPIYDILHNNCEKYNIDPRIILWVTSNRRETKNYEYYTKTNNIKNKINVHHDNYVEYHNLQNVSHNGKLFNQKIYEQLSTIEQYDLTKYLVNQQHENKFYASLSRRVRPYRAIASFMLCQEEFSKRGIISQDKTDPSVIKSLVRYFKVDDIYTHSVIEKWCDTLPLIADHDDFSEAWHHIDIPYRHIHDKTIFFIANETVQYCPDDRMLLLSEKTTRPISNFQPFIVWGIQGIHQCMKEWGYELYEDIFDYSFDDEPDPIKRYQMILSEIKKLCAFLETLSREERVSWRFSHQEKLIYNYENLSKKPKIRFENFKQFILNLPEF